MKVLPKKKRIEVLDILNSSYPDAECALNHKNKFELLVAVALSAQTTDKSVNLVTPKLFEKYPTPNKLKDANIEEVKEILKSIGMYKTKGKNIINIGRRLTEEYNGEIPEDYEDLISLPGVGRKTANVVLSVGFGHPRIPVDTHVFRVSNRIGLCHEKDVLKTELALMKNLPKDRWSKTHHDLIFHGRACCQARKPKCDVCAVNQICQEYSLKS